MELALYCPDCGFYEKEKDNIGKGGDFYTSVSVGPLFGQLLGHQFCEWFELDGSVPKTEVRIVEAGAHDGRLAADILGWIRQRRAETFQRLKYRIVEPSKRRRGWQRETLKEFSETVEWVGDLSELNSPPHVGYAVIFSNELLDAMPVRRLGWDAKVKKWFEWGVAMEGDRFVWDRIEKVEGRMQNAELEAVLPDGYTIEISPAAESWWRAAALVLSRGKLVALDYGFTVEEQFSPGRMNGTLRAYHRHQITDDVLANPGEQDLTAHVNFSAIQNAGEEVGLETETFSGQAQFLTWIVERIFKRPERFGEWGPKQTRQLQTLIHPEHLGRAFRVLVQSR